MLYAGKLDDEYHTRTYGEMVTALDLRSRGGLIIGVTNTKTGREYVNPSDDLRLDPDTMALYLARERLLDA